MRLPRHALLILATVGTSGALDNPGVEKPVSSVSFDGALLLGGTTQGYPSSRGYLARRALPAALPGFLISAVFAAYFVLWVLFRTSSVCFPQCCRGSGCRRCCGNPDTKRERNKCKLCCQCLGLLLVLGVAVPCCALGFHSAARVGDGLETLIDCVSAEAHKLTDNAALADSLAGKFGLAEADSRLLGDAMQVEREIMDEVDRIGEVEAVRFRTPAIYCFYGLFLAVPVFALMAFFRGWPGVATAASAAVMVCLVITWAVFGASMMIAVVFQDTCAELTKFHNFQPNAIPAAWCPGTNESAAMYGGFHWQAAAAADRYQEEAWVPEVTSMSELGIEETSAGSNDYVANYAWRASVVQDTSASAASYHSEAVVPGGGGTCFPFDASTANQTCTQQAIVSAADGMMATSYVTSCQYLQVLAEQVVTTHCIDTLDAFTELFIAHGAIGVAYVFLLAVLLRGQQDWAELVDERKVDSDLAALGYTYQTYQ